MSHCAISSRPLVPAAEMANVATVHDPGGTAVERIDPGGGPGKIGERQPGHDAQCDVGVGRVGTGDGRAEHRDGALGDGRVARHRVEHVTVLDRRGEQRRHNRRVHAIEIGLGVVTVVEALERHARRGEFVDGRVAGGPHEADGCCRDRVARRRHDQVATGRPQTDDGNPTRGGANVASALVRALVGHGQRRRCRAVRRGARRPGARRLGVGCRDHRVAVRRLAATCRAWGRS